MSALLIAGKWALNVVPNVEVVTLLCALYGYTFGFIAVIPACIFCLEETLAWGVYTWVIDYFVHWNVVVCCFAILGRFFRARKSAKDMVLPSVLAAVLATLLTAVFGVFTSAVDAVFACIYSEWSNFFYYFGVIYARGVILFVVHIVSNAIIFSVLFMPLAMLMRRLKDGLFPRKRERFQWRKAACLSAI